MKRQQKKRQKKKRKRKKEEGEEEEEVFGLLHMVVLLKSKGDVVCVALAFLLD